jgi:hypothetical protein
MFLGGLGLWVATVVVTFVTGNLNLVPTIILLGSFLVPVVFVSYAFGHADPVLTAQRIFTAVVSGGVLGVLGAAVGFGFAALESAGYGFNALFSSSGLSLLSLVESEVLRGILTPVGHGLWDASQGIAVWLTLVVTGSPVQWLEVQLGQAPAVTSAQLQLFTILSWGLLALDALLGVQVLRGRWNRATAPDRPPPPPPTPLPLVITGAEQR